MLQNISWTAFLLVLVGLLGLYYLLLVALFARDILRKKARPPDKARRIWKPEDQTAAAEENRADDDHFDESEEVIENEVPEEEEKAFHSLELLARDIEEIISSAGEGYHKETLMSRLQQEISRYPLLNRLAFRIAVNNLIIKHAQHYCQIEISKEEAEQLWATAQS